MKSSRTPVRGAATRLPAEYSLSRSSAPRHPILHPFLIAAYPVIALLAHNIEEIKAVVALRALLIALVAAGLLFLVLNAAFKERYKAALLTTLVLVLFFSYGHVYNYLDTHPFFGFHLGRHRILAPVWLAILVWAGFSIYRTHRLLESWNRAANLVSIIALIMPIWQLGAFAARSMTSTAEAANPTNLAGLQLPSQSAAPDVYYIILDAYARDDVLENEFEFDNTPFLNQLESMGFYVARCSQSNYAQTQLSLSSSLNMNYLQDIDPGYSPERKTRVGVEELIRHGAVRQAFENLGYQTVAFETGFKGTQWEDADLYLTPNSDLLHNFQIAGGPNGFEVMLLRNSAGLILADGATVLPRFMQPDLDNPRRIHRDLILFDLEQLATLPKMPGPKFVFAHLVIPHPPYVFGPNGEFTDFDKQYVPGYRDQVTYLNSRLLELLPRMIADSATPPVIILQGDHGSIGSKPGTRTSILNAIHLPGDSGPVLYPSISPVNTFRLVFNQYFGGEYEVLEDTSYYSVYTAPFDFTVIPDRRSGCQ